MCADIALIQQAGVQTTTERGHGSLGQQPSWPLLTSTGVQNLVPLAAVVTSVGYVVARFYL